MKIILSTFFLLFLFEIGYSQVKNFNANENLITVELMEQTIDSSNFYYDQGIYTKSLVSNIKFLTLAKQTNDPLYISKAYRFLAYDFMVVNDTLLARENFENAKKYAEIFNDDLTIGLSLMDLANYHSRSDFDYEKSMMYHDLSIARIEKSQDSTELTKAYYNAIITAFYSGKFERASEYLVALGNTDFDPYKPKYFFSSEKSFWATYYNKKNQFSKAEEKAKEAIALAKISGKAFEMSEALEQLTISYYGQKKYKEAYDSKTQYILFIEEGESLREDTQSQAALTRLKVEQYQDKLDVQKEKTALQAEIAESKDTLNTILMGVCIGGSFIFMVLLAAYLKRQDLNEALRVKNKKYLKAKEKSELLAKAKNNFFSTVSHELRTPLYGVIGLSTILLEDPSLKTHEEDLKSLKFSADYLLALINDVLQINKIDSNNIDNDESQFNLRDFIQSIATTFEYMRLQNKNTININIDAKIPENLEGNVVRLSQILMNLVGNALKFTENGAIHISLSLEENLLRDDCTIRFSIADTGIGIPKDKQASIFEEFTQVESINYKYQGTGLGLPIVKKLLQASDSKIELESNLGAGTTVRFTLNFKEVTEQIAKEKIPILNQSLLKGKNILVAEDNRINQIVTKKILEKKGINCTLAKNGKEAIELLKKHQFDLILMDLNMPILDGFKATIAIRKFNKNIPIIALTAVEIEEVRNEIYASGMNDIIVKPYDVNKFASTIVANLLRPEIKETTNKKTPF